MGAGCGIFGNKINKADLDWLEMHTKHSREDLLTMYAGFNNDFPNGGMELDQFTAMFPDLNKGNVTGNLVFRVLDDDRSGCLGFKEFLQAIDLMGARSPDDKLRWAFKMYDEDNSREVDINEMENVMVAIFNMLEGAGVEAKGDPKEKAHYFFKKLDTSGDGSVSEDEFIKGSMADVELMSMLDQLFQAITGTGTGFVAKDQENDKSKENAWAKTIQDGVDALDAEKGGT